MNQPNQKYSKALPEAAKHFISMISAESEVLIIGEENNKDCLKAICTLGWIIKKTSSRTKVKMLFETNEPKTWKHLNTLPISIGAVTDEHKKGSKVMCVLNYSKNTPTITLTKQQPDNSHHTLEITDSQMASLIELIYTAFTKNCLITGTEASALLFESTKDPSHLVRFKDSLLHMSVLAEEIFDLLPHSPEKFLSLRQQLSKREIKIIAKILENTASESFSRWPKGTSYFLSRNDTQSMQADDDEIEGAATFTLNHFGTLCYGSTWGLICYPVSNGSVKLLVKSDHDNVRSNRLLEAFGVGTGNNQIAQGTYTKASIIVDPEYCLKEFVNFLHGHEYDRVSDRLIEAPYEIDSLL